MKFRWQPVLWLISGLLAAGVIYLIAGKPRGEPVTLIPAPSPAPISVHIIGAVTNPGIYNLPRQSRVQDAVNAAGGFLPEADQGTINLAAFIQDGEQINVLSVIPTSLPTEILGSTRSQSIPEVLIEPDTHNSISNGLVNINTATAEELETLPGIGPVTAARIIEYRETNGSFQTIEEILDVSGIGPVKFAGIKELITLQD